MITTDRHCPILTNNTSHELQSVALEHKCQQRGQRFTHKSVLTLLFIRSRAYWNYSDDKISKNPQHFQHEIGSVLQSRTSIIMLSIVC
jgi:hypothetical protein